MTFQCDKLKNEYATNNNIKLVRIKYNEDIEQILSELNVERPKILCTKI